MRKLGLIYTCIALPIAVVLVAYFFLASTIRQHDSAVRNMVMARMKQLGLAMAIQESQTGSFPTRAIRDEQGKALLSWRVALLPYLEQDALYTEFHLDEPWDSPHNRALIAKMPSIFSSNDDAADKGETHFLAVVGKGASFADDGDAAKFGSVGYRADIIFLVEADHVVPWTKPEDFPYDVANPVRGLGQQRSGEFFVMFGDDRILAVPTTAPAGIVKTMFAGSAPVDPETMRPNR